MAKKHHVHKRLVMLYLREVLAAYHARRISLKQGLEGLGLSRSNFFRYLRGYRSNPSQFGIEYLRRSPNRKLSPSQESEIEAALRAEKNLIDDGKMGQIRSFNFRALRDDLLRSKGFRVSSETIRRKAIALGLHARQKRGAKIYRQVETSKIGRLIQHDTSIHQWSPFMDRFYLILTVDDHSRRILYARFFPEETAMNHILSVRDVVLQYGIPLSYYTDQHSIFVYTERKDSWNRTFQTVVEDAQVQWKRVMKKLQIQHILAKTPQAKGKVERRFRYLQDRLVRRCAKEQVTTLDHAQIILDQEVEYYNRYQKHETTGQTPVERWECALREGRSVLRPFVLDEGKSWKDIFCLEYLKKLSPYGKTKVKGHEIHLKNSPTSEVLVQYISEGSETEVRVFSKGLLINVFKL